MKILIMQPNLITGGVEKSLVNFLNKIDYSKHEVDLYLSNVTGELLNDISKNVNVIGEKKPNEPMNVPIKSSRIKGMIKAMANKFPKMVNINYSRKLSNVSFPRHYDIAFVYHGLYTDLLYLLTHKVSADKKYAICHGDTSHAKFNAKYVIDCYKKLDKVFFVSKSCEKSFNKSFGKKGVKTGYLYNIQNAKEILEKSKEFDVEYGNELNIISVSRLSEEKAHLRSLAIFKKLKNEGYAFVWHILGSGEKEAEIKEYIKNNGLENNIKLYGNQVNPYPYIKSSDLLYLGSYHEAAPMVFSESMLLGVPVLTTRTCSADELVGDMGFVCENSQEGIYESLKEIIKNLKILKDKKNNLRNYKINNNVVFEMKEILINE